MYTEVGVIVTFIPLNVQLGYNIINKYLNCPSTPLTILKSSIGMVAVGFTYCVSHNSFDICTHVTKLEKEERFNLSPRQVQVTVAPDYAAQRINY